MSLPKIVLLPLVASVVGAGAAAQSPVDFSTENRLALDAYYGGRLDEAERRWSTCASLEPPAVTGEQLSTTAANLALTVERLGRRDEAIEWAGRSAPEAALGRREWYRAQEALAGLLADPRFTPIDLALAVAEDRGLEEREREARAARAAVGLAREQYAESVIVWQDGHSGGAYDLVFDPSGDRLVSVGSDRTVRLWSTRIVEPPRTLGLHSSYGVSARYSLDGEHILIFDSPAGTAMLYDGRSGERALGLERPGEVLLDAEFGRGNEVWTLSSRGRLRRANARTGRVELDLRLGFLAESIDLAPGGARAVIRGADGRARLLDTVDGAVLGQVGPAGLTLTGARFQTDGRIGLSGADDRIHILQVGELGDQVAIPREGNALAWESDDGRRLMVMGEGRSLELWDTSTGELISRLLPAGSDLRLVARGPGGIIAAAQTQPGSRVQIWDSPSGAPLAQLGVTATPLEMTFSADGRLAISTWGGIVIADPKGGGRALASRSGRVNSVALGPDATAATGLGGGFLLEASNGGPWSLDLPAQHPLAVRLWDLQTGRARSAHPGRNAFTRFSPDNRFLAVHSPRADSELLLPDGQSVRLPGQFARTLRFSPDGERVVLTKGSPPTRVVLAGIEEGAAVALGGIRGIGAHDGEQNLIMRATFSPDGAVFVTCAASNEVIVADGFDASEVERLGGHLSPITCAEFDGQGHLLVTASGDGTARVWDFEPPYSAPRYTLEGHGGTVWCCAFSPDGSTVVTGGSDGTVRLWDAETGAARAVLTGHSGAVRRLAFHPLTGELVTVSSDGTARIWDPLTGDALHVLRGHSARVKELEFAADGRIVTCGEDATVRVWSAEGRLLATRVEYHGGGWLTFEPQGRYVAGGDAAEWARVQVGGETLPLSSYAAVLEDPGAVQRSLAGETLSAIPALKSAPTLETTDETSGTVDVPLLRATVKIEDSYGLRDLTIERDGVPWRPELALADLGLAPGLRTGLLELVVPFRDGASEIVVRVRVTNDRDVKSVPLTLQRTYVPPSGDLFLITIAVADYDDERLDLAAPLRDADALAARMRAEEGDLYSVVHHLRYQDADVTKTAMEELLVRLVDETGEEDTVMVFVAGHGAKDSLGRYFFLTPGATPDAPLSGIGGAQLHALVTWQDLAARRRVLLIDTCHAGKSVGGAWRGVGSDEAYTKAQVDDLIGSGVYIVAGSSEFGAARETEENGVFTTALLRGLDGEADTAGNRDGTVDIAELIEFARQVVGAADGPQRVTTPKTDGGDPFPLARTQ